MKLGCGMYGLAFELEKDFWGTMQKLADAGFTAIEPLYAFPNDPALAPDSPVPAFLKTILWDDKKVAEYQPRLREMGLEISSLHVGFFGGKDLKEGCEQLVDCAKKSGITHFLTSLEFDNEEKTLAAAELLNKAEEYLKDTGVSLGYHNHAMEFNKIADGSDRTWMDLFLEKTVSDVKCQLDTGWQMYGGSQVQICV